MKNRRRVASLGFGPLILSAAGVLAAAGCGEKAANEHGGQHPLQNGTPTAVTLSEARRALLDTQYIATATIRGRNTAILTSKGVGYVRALHVTAGDRVEAGQLLVELDTNDVQAGLIQAQAGASEAEASVIQAQREVEGARASHRLTGLTLERTRRLVEQKAATQQQLDEAETANSAADSRERMAEASLARARAGVAQAQAGIGVARVSVSDRRVVAPFAGRVVSRSVEIGNLAQPGSPLLTLEDQGALRAEAIVDESQTAHIALGDAVDVEIESIGARLSGKVGEIVPAVDAASRAYLVKVDLTDAGAGSTNGAPNLHPGMFARARFKVGQAEHLVVPTDAVSSRGQLDRVFVAEKGLARLRLVTVGESRGELTEVLSGLAPGETVVRKPAPGLVDATPIATHPAASEQP